MIARFGGCLGGGVSVAVLVTKVPAEDCLTSSNSSTVMHDTPAAFIRQLSKEKPAIWVFNDTISCSFSS